MISLHTGRMTTVYFLCNRVSISSRRSSQLRMVEHLVELYWKNKFPQRSRWPAPRCLEGMRWSNVWIYIERVSPKSMDGELFILKIWLDPCTYCSKPRTPYYTASKPVQEFCFREVFSSKKNLFPWGGIPGRSGYFWAFFLLKQVCLHPSKKTWNIIYGGLNWKIIVFSFLFMGDISRFQLLIFQGVKPQIQTLLIWCGFVMASMTFKLHTIGAKHQLLFM